LGFEILGGWGLGCRIILQEIEGLGVLVIRLSRHYA
jgi:hypothetical protein